jgi:hypothetical protein
MAAGTKKAPSAKTCSFLFMIPVEGSGWPFKPHVK